MAAVFHLACLILLHLGHNPVAVGLAWLFVVGRILHSTVQILTGNVRLRGAVFTVNFLAVIGLWLLVVLAARFSAASS
ncbi:MAPEG family protein [Lysobacter korlensis]|uniref:MAPEG family protein n=1 Tax=Lysobacter korlensis TaxID=553636 RepID=A0ABV6RLZ5_9GAMM